ncbi:MAG: MarR family transcriptional regulator, partial [Bacteroidota bacterium]
MNYIAELEDLALGSRLKQLSDLIMSDGKRIYSNSGVDFDPTWFPVFKLLSDNAPLGVVEIADRLGVSHPYVVKVIKALEKKHLVINEVHEHDGRKRSIKLSPAGEELLPRLKFLWADIDAAIKTMLEECRNNLIMSLSEVEKSLNELSLFDRVEHTRKARLMSGVTISTYTEELSPSFKELNLEWLQKYFTVEPVDVEVLDRPKEVIIDQGGEILFARWNGEVVGTCALVNKGGLRF